MQAFSFMIAIYLIHSFKRAFASSLIASCVYIYIECRPDSRIIKGLHN